MNSKQKIFCIGLSMTGITSIAVALRTLGYKANAMPMLMKNTSMKVEAKRQINRVVIYFCKTIFNKRKVLFRNTYCQSNKLQLDSSIIDQNDAVSDTPVVRFYKELDVRYPKSKFILTIRDMDSWLISCRRHFQKRFTEGPYDQLNFDLYGTNFFNEELFREAYERHVSDVDAYFRHRKEDLLILNICSGEGFEKICHFLGRKMPVADFPHYNKG